MPLPLSFISMMLATAPYLKPSCCSDHLCRLALSITRYWTKCFYVTKYPPLFDIGVLIKRKHKVTMWQKWQNPRYRSNQRALRIARTCYTMGKGSGMGYLLGRTPLCPLLSQISAIQNRGTGNLCCLSPQCVVLCCCIHRKSRPHVNWLGPLHHSVVSTMSFPQS